MTAATPSNSCLKGHGFVIYDASHNYNEPVNLVLQRSIWWGKALKNGPLKAAMSRKSDVKYSTGDECDIKATAPASSSCTKEAHAVDPMLATGNSSVAAIDRLKEAGATDLRMLCLLAAPEGVARMKEAHPDVPVFTAALDEKLNENGYIVPGLGDAGDRMFGTQ